MTDQDKPKLKSNVRLRNETFGKLIVAAGLPMLCINHDAAMILDMMDGTMTIANIADAIHENKKTVKLSQIRATILDFVGTLSRLSLIE